LKSTSDTVGLQVTIVELSVKVKHQEPGKT